MAFHLLDPISASDWDRRRARHLLNRAGFGIPFTAVERLTELGPAGAVDDFLDYKGAPEALPEPDWLDPPREIQYMREAFQMKMNRPGVTEEDKEAARQERQKLQMEFNQEQRRDLGRLKAWWLRRILESRRPLQEKMTLFWHGHFAVSAQKVQPAYLNYELNTLFRNTATGNFKMLTYEVGCTAAMLRYLDNQQNVRRSPNENWARELMELFTLGPGAYTEDDIKNSARAFTGWGSNGEQFVYRLGAHDQGDKVFMGRRGNLNGNDIFDTIFEQPAASRFIATKLWTYFAYPDPEEEVVLGLAETLRESGFDLQPMLERMFLSRAFYSEKAIGTQIKSPVQLAVSLLSDLRIDPDGPQILGYVVNATRLMGQDLFYPPNVKGWDGGEAWISTNRLMTRYNLANFLVNGVASDEGPQLRQLRRQRRRSMDRAEQARDAAVMGEGSGGSGGSGGAGGPGGSMMAMEMVGDPSGPKGIRMSQPPFDAASFFSRARGLDPDEAVDFMSEYFLGYALREDQRREIQEALAPSADSKRGSAPGQWEDARIRAAVRLLLSSGEYQLC